MSQNLLLVYIEHTSAQPDTDKALPLLEISQCTVLEVNVPFKVQYQLRYTFFETVISRHLLHGAVV